MKDIMASASGTGLLPTVEPVPVSPPDGASIPDALHDTANGAYTDGLRDLAGMSHVSKALGHVLRDCAKLIDKTERENSGLRIGFWNFMRKAGLHQDLALQIINEAAQGMSAGTAKTAQPVEGEARQPGPQGCAPTPSGDHP